MMVLTLFRRGRMGFHYSLADNQIDLVSKTNGKFLSHQLEKEPLFHLSIEDDEIECEEPCGSSDHITKNQIWSESDYLIFFGIEW
jgi:hypothetical protein